MLIIWSDNIPLNKFSLLFPSCALSFPTLLPYLLPYSLLPYPPPIPPHVPLLLFHSARIRKCKNSYIIMVENILKKCTFSTFTLRAKYKLLQHRVCEYNCLLVCIVILLQPDISMHILYTVLYTFP